MGSNGRHVQKTRRELISQYKSAGTPAGVFQIRNLVNGKLFVGTAQNLPGILNSNRFQLKNGSHPNKALQADWKMFGEEAFAFEPLDELKAAEEGPANIRAELSLLEQMWLEKLEPWRRLGFFQQGAMRFLHAKKTIKTGVLQARLEFVIQKLDEGVRFLPIEVLGGMTFEKRTSCRSTKTLFMNSFENRTLVRTSARIGGREKTIFIKGVWDDGGNFPLLASVIAYEPAANSIYELDVKNGRPVLGDNYHFTRNELQELLIPYA